MNGYTTITIDEKTIGLKFAWLAIKWFTEASQAKAEVYFAEIETVIDEKIVKQSSLTTFGISKLIQCAYRNNNEIKEVEDKLLFEDFYKWTEEKSESEEGLTEISEVLRIYAESSFSRKLVAEVEKKSKMNGIQEAVTP